MSTAFVRQLGSESGVQLNPLRDDSEIPSTDNSDQIFGIIGRFTRGRIDKPFKVDRGNIYRKLGNGEQVRVSALNEAWVHVVEALNNGAYEAVVQRLATDTAVVKHAVVRVGFGAELVATVNAGVVTAITVSNGGQKYDTPPKITLAGVGTGATATCTLNGEGTITAVTVTAGGTGYTVAPTVSVEQQLYFEVADNAPAAPYLLSVKHLECFNDGIKLRLRADEKRSGGVNVANDVLTLEICDANDVKLYSFTGSLSATAKDDFGEPFYLPDVIAARTDAVVVEVGVTGASASIKVDCAGYGYDEYAKEKWAESAALVCFDEGGTGYTTANYVKARQALQNTTHNYAYISSGGTQSVALLAQLAQLAFDTNRQLRFDVPGNLTPEAAIAFVEQLNMGASKTAHLMHAFWTPLKSDDPAGVNPKDYFGSATLNIAYACGRNAVKNSKGFAAKNYPIAGREWPLARTRITQTSFPSGQELSALAKAKINPVVYEEYTGGGRYVFRDSLTCALVDNSLKKLISVADMSSSIDDAVTRYSKDVLQLPIKVATKKMSDFLEELFKNAEASGWLVPAADPAMGGKSYRYHVAANEARPYDAMDYSYWLRYDGTNRQVFVTQTLVR